MESLPLPLLLLLALYTGLESLSLPAAYERIGSKLIFALVVIVVFYFLAKVLIVFLNRAGQTNPALLAVTQPATMAARVLFAMLALFIILERQGISLTGVWTTLGVGSVAVALALQETLGSFFTSLYLLIDRPIRPGDYVKLDAGHEGFVMRIGWRSTTFRTGNNNVVVVPNGILAKSVITNYSMPEPWMTVVIPVAVAYGTDPRRVEKILMEVAEGAAREGLEGLRTDRKPVVRLIPGFGESSLNFSLIVQVQTFVDQDPVQSELRKRILERFEEGGIEIPFPTRSVVLDKSAHRALANKLPKA